MEMSDVYSFGWKPDPPDHRDLLYSAPLLSLRSLPASVDLRPKCPPVYDQGHIGSCTANAIAGAIQFQREADHDEPDFVPSRLFIYYNERVIENSVPYDAGAQIRDGIKSVNKLGVPPESDWPYSDQGYPTDPHNPRFAPGAPAAKKPPKSVYTTAAQYKVTSYARVQQLLPQLKGCLADGWPFVFGFSVYENFFGPDGRPNVTTPMPSGSQIGGHAVVGVGYDDAKSTFIVRNSWGPDNQDGGYFYMPYSYVTEPTLSSDFWTISTGG
jgi:C1A family cysteine protease